MLFRVIRDLTSRGVSIVYISHHLEEALQVTDYAVVLRDGSITATADAKDIDLEWTVRHMVGENFDLGSPPTNYDNALVDHMSFDVRAGEIVCIYGLMGAGRTELLECLAGRAPMTGGRIFIGGEEVSKLSIAERIAKGLALVPEDRQRDGLVQTMSVGANLSLASISAFVKGMLLNRAPKRELVNKSIRSVRIKTEGASPPIGSLSGGNQQKVVIGKVLATGPKVILLDEPNRGIDVGAKAEVIRLLGERAAQGLAVVFSTSEAAECLSIAHRIIVMRRGSISAQFGSNVTKEEIMAASGEAVVSRPSRRAKL